MAVFKTLKTLKEKSERSGFGGLSRENFLSLKSGESVKLFFRQEVAEDGKNFDKVRGAANVVTIHQSPVDFVRKFACTADNEEYGFKCWACEASRIPGNGKLRGKQRILINVLVQEEKNGPWVAKVLETSISPKGGQPGNLLIDYQEEYETLIDREYKFGRVGEKLNTSYSLIPLSPSDVPTEDKDLELIDTTKVYRVIPYEEQQEFMMAPKADATDEKPSDGNDW